MLPELAAEMCSSARQEQTCLHGKQRGGDAGVMHSTALEGPKERLMGTRQNSALYMSVCCCEQCVAHGTSGLAVQRTA